MLTDLELSDDPAVIVLSVARALAPIQLERVQPLLEAVEVGHRLQLAVVDLESMVINVKACFIIL